MRERRLNLLLLHVLSRWSLSLGPLSSLLLLLKLMRHNLMILPIRRSSIMHLLHPRHNLVPHVQPQLAHFPLFDHQPVFSLPYASSGAHAVPAGLFIWSQWGRFLYLLLLLQVRRLRHGHGAGGGG